MTYDTTVWSGCALTKRSNSSARQESASEQPGLFDISYIVLKDVISPIAKDYEFKNRNDKQDFRHIWFSKELDLWTLFGEDFYERAKQEMDEILLNHPYIDE